MATDPERPPPVAEPGLPEAPATGAVDPYFTELAPGEEPITSGTLFLTMVILMIIAAVWMIVFVRLVQR